jgi:hypothetical protein
MPPVPVTRPAAAPSPYNAVSQTGWAVLNGIAKNMNDELQFLVHFFNDKEYLFKTITMAGVSQVDEICNKISSQKGWYWTRFAKSDRHDYLRRRLFVEKELYEDYTQEYGSLKEKIPVYFYLYPNITKQKAKVLGQQRMRHGEIEAQILMVKIQDIEDTKNITFTLNDSHTAYWKRAAESGKKCRGDGNTQVVLEDHNKVFPFSIIEQIHQKYKAQQINYEIQIWDYQLLNKISYTILEKEET